jgi:hypothetical protein
VLSWYSLSCFCMLSLNFSLSSILGFLCAPFWFPLWTLLWGPH